MTNAEISKRLGYIHQTLQHGPMSGGSTLIEMLEGIDEALRIINSLNMLDRLETKVRKLEKQLLAQK